jgi:hypothetical protein
MNNYQYSISKIKTAKTPEQLSKVEDWLERMYNAGFVTAKEFWELDRKLVEHSLKLEGVI